MKNHCMVVHAYYPVREPRVEREVNALLKHGYTVDVICLRQDGEPATEIRDGVRIFRLPVKRHRGKGAAVQLLEYLAFFTAAFARLALLHRRERYDVVQIHNLPDFLVFAALVPKLAGARVILDIHDVMPEFYASRFKSGMSSWPVRLVRWQEWLSCRFADHVITVTDLWRETLIQRGVRPDKVSVVMNVANDQIFQDSAAEEPPERTDDHFNVLYHGTITERYGIDLLIRAIDRVRHTIPEVRLTIHGVGEYRDALVQLTAELGLQDYVQFSTRFIPTPEMPQFIRQADVGVVPYRRDVFTDGILPTKLMEYAALGVPSIVARTSVIAAYFDDTMVQFFKPGDVEDLAHSITLLYHDRQRLSSLAQHASRFNQRYNWTTVSAGYVALVEQFYSELNEQTNKRTNEQNART
ncbi:MAG TPA: glycosyltransferase family 4 protein [Herpetosiphonaceae bacterium]